MVDKAEGITLMESTNDDEIIKGSVALLKDQIDGMKVVALEDKGHFTLGDMGTVEFPELLGEIVDE